MGQTKEQKVIKQVVGKPTTQKFTPIATDMFLPNHSGDHSAGKLIRTPSNDLDLVNKKYVDDSISDIYINVDGGNSTGNFGGIALSPMDGGNA